MRNLFRRTPALRVSTQRRLALQYVCLGAFGAACLLISGCGLAPKGNARAATAQPSYTDPNNSCAGLRQLLAAHNVAPTPTVGSGGHRVYALNELGPTPSQAVWQPGATMRFFWCAIPAEATTDAVAQPERMTIKILGPFKSVRDASQMMQTVTSQVTPPGSKPLSALGPVAASAAALTTTSWSDADMSTTLQLPSTPKAACYVFLAQNEALPYSGSDVMSLGGLSAGIIQVGEM